MTRFISLKNAFARYHLNISPAIAGLVVFIFALLSNMTFADRSLYADAGNYFLGDPTLFFVDNHFSLLSFNDPLRGYVLPLLFVIPNEISRVTGVDALTIFRLLAAALVTLMVAWILPGFFQKLFGFRASPWQNLLFAGLILVFWRGHINFPLSDFPALFFLFCAVFLYLILFDQVQRPNWLKGLMLLSIGVCLAAAASIRPTYRIPMVIFVLLILTRLVLKFREGRIAGNLVFGLALAGGLGLVMVPQAMMNSLHFGVLTPFSTDQHGKNNLGIFQLYYGIRIQRIDVSSLLNGKQTPMIDIPDAQGINILKKSNLDIDRQSVEQIGVRFTIRRYLKMIYRHPVDFATLYFRHFLNGLDLVYPSRHTVDVFKDQIPYRLGNYTLWFLAFYAVWKVGSLSRRLIEPLCLLGIIASPAFISIFSAVETRFFLPIFILLYALVSYSFFSEKTDWKNFLTLRTLLAYCLFTAACFTYSATVFSTVGVLMR